MELKGVEYLRKKLEKKRTRVLLRYQYYDNTNTCKDFGISTPPKLANEWTHVGWCSKAVDSLADRMVFREFRNDVMDMNGIYKRNNPDVLFPSAIKSALIGSCSFIYITVGEEGPRLQVIDGANATGIIDPITNMLTEGYAVLSRDEKGKTIKEAYMIPGKTAVYENNKLVGEYTYSSAYPLLVPIIYKPDAKRPFGHSRISRSCMKYVDAVMRTIKRSEISAEFYSYPQKYATGLADDVEGLDKWRATMASMLIFTKDADGDKPTVGQFVQQSMTPHLDQVKLFASMFAGECGLTMDDLGFVSSNPSSSDAIKAAHETLRTTARSAMGSFGSGFLNAGFLAACVRDDQIYSRELLYDTVPCWEPIFEPDASTLSAIGDGAIKINQAIPGFFNAEKIRDLTGIEGA